MAVITNKQTKEDLDEIINDGSEDNSGQREEIEEKLGLDLEDDDSSDGGDDEEVIEDKKAIDDDESDDGEGEEEDDEEGNPPEKKSADFKELYKGSTQEAMILKNKNEKFSSAVEEAKKIEVTDEDLKAAYPTVSDWEKVDPLQRQLMKESLTNKRRFDKVGEVYEETQRVTEWAGKTKTWLESEDNLNAFPQLRGREDDFATFCLKPSRVGADFEELVRSFSYDLKSTKHKGSLFHSGGGGDKAPEKKQLSSENVKWLRENRPKKYRELLMAGKLKFE